MLSFLRSKAFSRLTPQLRTLPQQLPSTSCASIYSAGWNDTANINTISALSLIQVRHRSNRSRRGLYDGKDVRTGNFVSFSMKKSKRTFKPNVFKKRLWSDALDGMIPFHVTTSALRSIDKAGGLDNYLMKNSFTEGEGFRCKKKILQRVKIRAYFARKAEENPGMYPPQPEPIVLYKR